MPRHQPATQVRHELPDGNRSGGDPDAKQSYGFASFMCRSSRDCVWSAAHSADLVRQYEAASGTTALHEPEFRSPQVLAPKARANPALHRLRHVLRLKGYRKALDCKTSPHRAATKSCWTAGR